MGIWKIFFKNIVKRCTKCSENNNINNYCYITGYDYKCGHDNGWAFEFIDYDSKLQNIINKKDEEIN